MAVFEGRNFRSEASDKAFQTLFSPLTAGIVTEPSFKAIPLYSLQRQRRRRDLQPVSSSKNNLGISFEARLLLMLLGVVPAALCKHSTLNSWCRLLAPHSLVFMFSVSTVGGGKF